MAVCSYPFPNFCLIRSVHEEDLPLSLLFFNTPFFEFILCLFSIKGSNLVKNF